MVSNKLAYCVLLKIVLSTLVAYGPVGTDVVDSPFTSAGVTIFNSDNDQETIHKSVQIIRDKVKNIGYKEFHNYGHFCYEDLNSVEFPELIKECLAHERDVNED